MNLIWKLLKENISKAQLIGFFIANLIGMTIILVAIQFYADISPIFSQKDDLMKKDFFTITKKVGLLNTLNASASGFSANEIEELKNSGFVKDIGAFVPSQYGVHAGIDQNGVSFGTEMFFESLPDKFIDVKSNDWHFSPESDIVPIILPKNYLDLYNFGFAESRSLPKISEGMISIVTMHLTIFGNGQRILKKGRIVGFSNRVNTILVPDTFMDWANQNFGSGPKTAPSRLMLEISNIADPKISEYFKEKGYEVEGENVAVSRMSSFLKILVTIVIGVGAIICILAFVILTLSIYLLLEKNMDKLQKLRMLGYGKRPITRPYELLTIGINLSTFVLSFILMFLIKLKYNGIIKNVWSAFEPSGIFYTFLTGLLIFGLLSVINVVIIRRKIK